MLISKFGRFQNSARNSVNFEVPKINDTANFAAPAERPASSVVYRVSEFTKAKSRLQNFKISE